MKTSRAILVVEDHADSATILSKVLSNVGHSVQIAHNVAEARNLAAHHRFDLVVCDLGLPDGDGCALMRELVAQYGLKGVALSGSGMEDDVTRALEAGFSTHVLKPVSFDRLIEALDDAAQKLGSTWKTSDAAHRGHVGPHF